MVLVKPDRLFLCSIFFLSSYLCFPQDNYWQKLFKTAFSNSTKVSEIKADYISSVINKKQYDYNWFPKIGVGMQEAFSATRGDYLYVLNQTPDPQITWVTVPSALVSVNQKLPGNGTFSLGTGYGFNYSFDHKAFIQWPNIQLSFNQKLSRGAFGIAGNPEQRLIKEQLSYSDIIYRRNLSNELQNILELIERSDTLTAQENYYKALAAEYESELNTAKEKFNSGLQSNLQAHYAEHQYSEAVNNLESVCYDKENILKELHIIIPDFTQDDLNNERSEVYEEIKKLYHFLFPEILNDEESITDNLEAEIYSSMLKQYQLQYQNNEINYAPELFISSSLKPDSSFNSKYSDWYKSFRVFKETPYPVDFSFTVGIQKQFELPGAAKLRKEIYILNREIVNKEKEVLENSQKNELKILIRQIDKDSRYLSCLEAEIQTEQDFRGKRKELLNNSLITQDEFLQTETLYYKIFLDYINTFWKIINNEIKVINMCYKEPVLINHFTGGNYEF